MWRNIYVRSSVTKNQNKPIKEPIKPMSMNSINTPPISSETTFNGFPRLETIPESLQPFFKMLRKSKNVASASLNNENPAYPIINITYSPTATLYGTTVIMSIPSDNFQLTRFNHQNYKHTHITLRKLW